MKDQKQRPNTIYRERTVFGNITTAVRLNIQNSAKSKDQINFPKQKLSFICLPKNIGSFQTFFQEFSKNLQKVWWQLHIIDSVLVTIVTIELCYVGDGIVFLCEFWKFMFSLNNDFLHIIMILKCRPYTVWYWWQKIASPISQFCHQHRCQPKSSPKIFATNFEQNQFWDSNF